MVKLVSKENLEYYTLRVKNKFSEIRDDLDKLKAKATTYEKVTYAELVTKRQNRQLTAGGMYRIVDYETTVANDEEARSAGHVFDLIVRAISSDTLSEEAYAIQSERDTDGYFSNANLNAWQVWYCLDNDTTRFQWADEENGKGVIYRLIDEWRNDCPYDFKNIQFKRYWVSGTSPHGELADLDGTYIGMPGEIAGLAIDTEDYVWAYTFSYGERTETPADGSLKGFVNSEDYSFKGYYGDNVIKPTSCRVTEDDETGGVMCLNNVIWFTSNDYAEHCQMNGNVVEGECVNMTLSGFATRIGYDSRGIIMGEGCYTNTIESGACANTFGNNCNCNTFGNNCYHNTFGNSCYYNTFGNDCNTNTFGNYCGTNTFGNYCSYNTFGNYCCHNTFGNFFQDNTLGNECGNNSLGNYWSNNSFGNYLQYITVGEGVNCLNVTGGTDSNYCVQNAYILNGTKGKNSSNRLTVTLPVRSKVCHYVGLNSKGELKIWTPADLVE